MKKILISILAVSTISFAQEKAEEKKLEFIFEPDSLSLHIGETGSVTIKLVDKEGNLANNPFYVYGRPRQSLESSPRISDSTGVAKVTIKAFKPGNLSLSVRSIAQKRSDRVMGRIPIHVPAPKSIRVYLKLQFVF